MVDEARHLLEELRRLGGRVELTTDSVRFRAPVGAVPDDLADALAQHRAAVCDIVVEEELAAQGLLRCQECRTIQPGHYLEAGICDECCGVPAPPEQSELFRGEGGKEE